MFRLPLGEHSVADSKQPSLALPAAGLALLLVVLSEVGRFYFRDVFDRPITLFLNSFAQASQVFDRAMQMLQGFHVFKGVAAFTVVYAAFARNPGFRARLRLVAGCAAAARAAGTSRVLQVFLPTSARPKFDPNLDWSPPYGGSEALRDWSSFPSDHATLLFGVTCAVILVDRRLGLLMLGIAALVNFARVYTGLHYPTDILGGALLGCAFVLAAAAVADRIDIPEAVVRWTAAHPGLLAACGFFSAVQAAMLFQEPRDIAVTAARVLGF